MMSTQHRQFNVVARLLHWVMAALVLAMLGIGVAMVASLADYHLLVSLHRPLGAAILVLVVVRFVNRLLNPPPPFPATMSPLERRAATVSELLMYGLMFALPLVGWGMLSAARYPVVLFGPVHLPFILPHDLGLYAVLRQTHTVLAYLLFLMFIAHFGAVLYHMLIVRDGILLRMAPWNLSPVPARPPEAVPSPGLNSLCCPPSPLSNVTGDGDRALTRSGRVREVSGQLPVNHPREP
jgi:cytochrome b561